MLGRKKSVLGKLKTVPLWCHVFRPFLRGFFGLYYMFYVPCLEANVLYLAVDSVPRFGLLGAT